MAINRTRRLALAFIAALAASSSIAAPLHRNTDRIAHCSWDAPGHNPFVGELPAALDRYTDIPADVRARLQQRMQKRNYDDLVEIRRDSIAGQRQYDPAIRDMHFGRQSVCKTVSRDGWSERARERGLVYCDSGHCILVPTVCRNVSRIAPLESGEPDNEAQTAAAPPDELIFDPPGAGAVDETSFERAASSVLPPLAALPPLRTEQSSQMPDYGSGYTPPVTDSWHGGRKPPIDDTGPGPDAHLPPPPPTSPVPEPGTAALALLGLAGVLRAQRRAGKPN